MNCENCENGPMSSNKCLQIVSEPEFYQIRKMSNQPSGIINHDQFYQPICLVEEFDKQNK
jgi:hypothetical protein